MKAGFWNLAFGLAAVAAGASGRFRLPFTEDPKWLMVAGGAVAALGAIQLLRGRDRPDRPR
jgi:hypothetical protein